MADCIFCRIIARQLPCNVIHEDERILAFRDINPQAPTHVLIVPKKHIAKLTDLTDGDMPLVIDCTRVANQLARQEGIAETGFRLLVNCGAGAGQSVWHIHYHLLGGRPLHWPPG